MKNPFEPTTWSGRTDPQDGDRGLRWHNIVNRTAPGQPPIDILGFAVDEGVRRNQGRPGAAQGPNALRKALSNLPVHKPFELTDHGDVTCENQDLELAQAEYADIASEAIHKNRLVIGLGGGHEIAYASYQALRLAKPQDKIGILNLDAHFDLRQEDRPTSGTPFLDALQHTPEKTTYFALGISQAANTPALFETAKTHKAGYVLDTFCTPANLSQIEDRLNPWLFDLDHLYLTIDLDALPASVAPGVSAPAARGIPLEFIEAVLKFDLVQEKLRIADIAELNPTYDLDDRTARTAARLVFDLVNTHLESKDG